MDFLTFSCYLYYERTINLVHTVLQYPIVNFFEISTNAKAASGSLE